MILNSNYTKAEIEFIGYYISIGQGLIIIYPENILYNLLHATKTILKTHIISNSYIINELKKQIQIGVISKK